MTEVTAPTPERCDIVAGLERLLGLIRLLSPSGGISLTTASTLARLAAAGPHRLSDLAAREGVTQPAMTQLVSRLERHGLAERRGHLDDRRVVMVHITPAGRELLDQRRQQRAIRLAGLLDVLSPEDERKIAAALPALARLTDPHAPSPEQPSANPADNRSGARERETA
ncbi:MAG TPA: MarR family transcriptional regulator [Pseudonocardia sp.]|uniref:MarR family winged helix-turn-helix transcriptional regulator n=1 Tax=Pseudonocardia sp. TaxID=60912 RepID=UPI002B73AFA7|nr:MarR family transcriptional regulator [Pseudonocardia sp.]HTF46768.1 MarR family transcriptional regulator [Pseudonocardia sp.]